MPFPEAQHDRESSSGRAFPSLTTDAPRLSTLLANSKSGVVLLDQILGIAAQHFEAELEAGEIGLIEGQDPADVFGLAYVCSIHLLAVEKSHSDP